jgi:cytosol alanyl aminopeptidase
MRRLLAVCLAAPFLGAVEPSFYLPDSTRPLRYRLDLRIDPSQPTFEGRAGIELEVSQASETIWLNGTDLTVTRATLDNKPVRVEAVLDQFLAVRGDSAIAPGRHDLSIEYSAKFTERAVGAYRRKSGGDWYVYTTFTPIDARRAFPCFDEPRFKTPWEVSIAAPDGLMAVANSRLVSESRDPDGRRRFRFAPTLPLPSEVVAFAVGPFDIVEGGVAGRNRIPVRVITPRGRAAEGRVAAESTAQVLSRLEDYTGIPYPWDKLDHIALIEGAYGAVENPGLIAYQAGILLLDPAKTSEQRRLAMRRTMAHELAHQWFGNLVTQQDWQDVWLSEGFAVWLSLKTSDLDLPPEKRGVARVIAKHRMMARDQGPRTRPVRKQMASLSDMRDVYSGTVYQKGGAVLAMTEQWLGEQAFQRSLHRYLRAHSFGNATTADLVRAIRDETGTDAGPVLAGFLDHTGVPLVLVGLDYGGRPSPTAYTPAEGPWIVPLCVVMDGLRPPCVLVGSDQTPYTIVETYPKWAFANAGGAGYYRVDPVATARVPLAQLTPAERMELVLDTLTLAPLP